MCDFVEPTRYEDFYGQRLNAWLMSEKLHGIWARWDGKQLLSRTGKRFNAPESFTDGLPIFPVDGELFAGYGAANFQKLCGLVRSKKPDWRGISFNLFDSTIAGSYTERYAALKGLVLPEHVKLIEQLQIVSDENRQAFLKSVLDKGGEGLVLRSPTAKYIEGLTNLVKKDKPMRSMEAICIAVNEGVGKLKGFIGSLTCQTESGVIFKVPNLPKTLLDQDRLFIGKNITVDFFGFTDINCPYQPQFAGVRDYE